MRQETGSNPNSNSKKVSIQLALDGHSFCGTEQTTASVVKLRAEAIAVLKRSGVDFDASETISASADQAFGSGLVAGTQFDLEFMLLTSRTILAPEQIMEPNCDPEELQRLCAGLLAASGMPIKASERAVMSSPVCGLVAIMAINCQLDDSLQNIAGARYTTPLLGAHKFTKPTIWVEQIAGLLYIKVYAPALQFCEVVAGGSEDEIIYLFEMLSREFAPRNFELIIRSEEPKKLKKLIGGGYAKVICNKK